MGCKIFYFTRENGFLIKLIVTSSVRMLCVGVFYINWKVSVESKIDDV